MVFLNVETNEKQCNIVLWFLVIVKLAVRAGDIGRRSLVLMVAGSMGLLAEAHNTLGLWFLEAAVAKQCHCAEIS